MAISGSTLAQDSSRFHGNVQSSTGNLLQSYVVAQEVRDTRWDRRLEQRTATCRGDEVMARHVRRNQ